MEENRKENIKNTPNVQAVLLDAGMEKGIHPSKKKTAGERLALLALTKTYGIEGVNGESPYYKSIEIKNDTVIVSFERANMWISGKDCFSYQNICLIDILKKVREYLQNMKKSLRRQISG